MIGYITIGAVDIERARIFYDSVLGTIGWATVRRLRRPDRVRAE
jgi:catechol 2,3-dioxygenase-like lactoylglutathione lyase family enzyme